jgi:hypothetical protein
MARAARRGNEHIVAPHARTCIGGTGRNRAVRRRTPPREATPPVAGSTAVVITAREETWHRVVAAPAAYWLGHRRTADVSSVSASRPDKRGSTSMAWVRDATHTDILVAITVLSGRSLPQEASGLAAGTSRKRIFSTRIDPSRRPDRAGSRGLVSAVSWGISPAKFRPSLEEARKGPGLPRSCSAGARSELRCTGRKRVPTMGQLGRCGLRSTDHRGWSLPILAGRSPAEVRPPGPELRRWTRSDAHGRCVGRALRTTNVNTTDRALIK